MGSISHPGFINIEKYGFTSGSNFINNTKTGLYTEYFRSSYSIGIKYIILFMTYLLNN